jgi:signal transduction histidine kinase
MAPGNSEFANAQNVIEIIQQVLDSWQLDINALPIQILFHSHEIEKGKFTLRLNRGDFFILASNLISNAIKFNRPGGSLTITLSLQYDNLVFQVEDTGNGIPLEMQDVIFEPFGYSSATGKKSQGTGLYLVKEAVNRGGGRIHLQSQPGEGTVIRIFLPFR